MKLRIFSKIFCVLSLSASFLSVKAVLEGYAQLITKVFDQNQESSVTIFHYSDLDNFREKDYLFRITRLLSKRNIVSITADFRDWTIMRQHYWEKNKEKIHGRRPMIVVVLLDQQSLDLFQKMCKELHSQEQLFFLVLFIESDKAYLREFCMNPDGKLFQLRLDALMVVKCYEDNRLRAWYTLDGENLKVSTWAIWDPSMEFLTMVLDYKHLKIDLNGRELNIATVDSSALTEWTKDGKLEGLFGKLLNELQQNMNFTWKLVKKVKDYGSWNATTNNWTGATNLLHQRKIDLLVTDLAFTSLRLTRIDYTIPLLNLHSMLYVQKPQSGTVIKWSGYFKFFDIRIWVIFVLIILLTPLILTLMKMKFRESWILSQLLLENYLNVWGIYCQQGLLEFPSATPLRLVYFSIFISSLIILNHYSAILISRLTNPIPDNFLPNVEAFIEDNSYKLITLKNGADYNIFEFGKTPNLKAMFSLMLKTDQLPESVQAGFDMVCEQKVGFFIVETARKMHDLRVKCNLHAIKSNLNEISSMALPKNSEYKHEMNRNFFRFEINGMLKRFYDEYFFVETMEDQKKSQVTIWEVLVLLAIVAGGIILSTIVLLLEKKIFFLHKITKGKKTDEVQKLNSIEYLTKWYNFENQRMNPDRYNLAGELNVKFIRNDHKHKIGMSPGINRISLVF